MKVAAAILYVLALVAALTIAPYAEGRFIIRKVSSAVPALPTTNLVVNLDASGNVYNLGTTQATNGQTVAIWPDAAGTAQDATQATEADKPIFFTNDGSGRKYLDFDGTDFLRYGSGSPLSGDAVTFYVVMASDVITSSVRLVGVLDESQTNHYARLGLTTSPSNGTPFMQVKDASTIGTASASAQVSTSTVYILHGSSNAAGNDRSVWIANASSGNNTTSLTYDHTVGDSYVVGADYFIGVDSANFNGKIYQVLIYDEEHDASERADTIAHLEDKWGL